METILRKTNYDKDSSAPSHELKNKLEPGKHSLKREHHWYLAKLLAGVCMCLGFVVNVNAQGYSVDDGFESQSWPTFTNGTPVWQQDACGTHSIQRGQLPPAGIQAREGSYVARFETRYIDCAAPVDANKGRFNIRRAELKNGDGRARSNGMEEWLGGSLFVPESFTNLWC